MRYPTRKAIDKFNELFGLTEDKNMQDWEIECSDPDRIDEFLDVYPNLNDDDEKFTLMALILGAFEEYHNPKEIDYAIWERIKRILIDEKELHTTHIEYYSYTEAENEDEFFPITPLMRQLLV